MSIWIYETGYEDFSTNGLGCLLPDRCRVTEAQNAVYELEMNHPMDEDGFFELLRVGRVLKVPVPEQTTPIIKMPATTSYEVWETNAAAKVYTKRSSTLGTIVTVTVPAIDPTSIKPAVVAVRGYTDLESTTTSKWKPNGNRVLETVEADVSVSVLVKDGSWYQVTTPNGNTGWMQASALTLVQTVAARPPETIQARKIRDQLFRIYRCEKDTAGGTVKAWARHISYDLLGNALLDCEADNLTVAQAIALIDAACTQADHGFALYTDSTETVTADWSRKGYLEALLNPDEGLLSLANLRLVRDNYDLFLLTRSTVSRLPVSYGTNLQGVTLDINEDSIVNRIVPVGKTKNGDPLYIDAEYVDSPRNNEATIIRAKVIEYSDVAEQEAKDGKAAVTLADAKTALIARANADFAAGIDMPDITVDVNFLQLGDTEEYAAYRELDRLYLGDLITVLDDVHDVELDAEITQVEYDVLTDRYTRMNVGVTDAARTIGSTASFMLPNGSLGGRKIAMGSLDGGHLQGASISGSHIKDSAITNSHFMNGTISGSIFEDGTITGSKIDASTFTNGFISGTAIDASTFENGSISGTAIDTSTFVDGTISGTAIDASTFTNGQISGTKINASTFTNGQISGTAINASTFTNGQISGSKIDSSTLTNIPYAQIKDLDVTGDAIFRQSVVGDGTFYLDRLIVNSANIGTATIGELMVRDAQGKLHKVLIGANGVVSSEEVKMDGQNLSNDAMMQVSQRLVWRQNGQPSSPFIGMIWMDTSLTPAGKPKEILKRCTAITPSVVWEVVQSNELHTNVIDVDDNGMNILTGGNLNLLAGGNLNIKNLGNTANIINMDSTGMTISSTGLLKLTSADSIIIGGNPYSVGAVNLLPYTDFSTNQIVNGWTSWQDSLSYNAEGSLVFMTYTDQGSGIVTPAIPVIPKIGDIWTVSFDAALNTVLTEMNYCNVISNPSDTVPSRSIEQLGGVYPVIGGGSTNWGRHSFTIKFIDNYTYPVKIHIGFGGVSSVPLTCRIKGYKIETGPLATDWSPSPQDTIDALTGIGTDISGLQAQIDGKIVAYWQTSDPSTGWTAQQKSDNTGDMWYDTDATTDALKRWNGTGWDVVSDDSAVKAYKLAATAKDTADGKRRVFITTPVPPYDVGDLWAGGSTGDLKRCSTAKAAGGSYAAGDWVLASKYTDDTLANTAKTTADAAATNATSALTTLDNIASDSKLTPVEKKTTKKEWDTIVSEKTKIDTTADSFSVPKTAYGTAYTNLSNYITPLLSDLTVTSNITGSTFRSTFKTYYDARQDILNAISSKAKTLADAAQSTASSAAAAASAAQGVADTAASNATNALAQLSDISADSKLTPVEKKSIQKEWDVIAGEKAKIDTEADEFSVSKTAYGNAYNALNTYLNGASGLLLNLNTTSDITAATFRANFTNYYNARQDVLNAITSKAKQLADNAQGDITGFLTSTLPGLQARMQVFYQASKPTYTAVGDLWYDTDSNPLEIWRCTDVSTQAHTAFTDPVFAQALSAASAASSAAAAAQGTANSKINTFVGDLTPTALAAGDLWLDTGNKNIWKRATAAGTGGWVPYLTAAGYLNSTGITIDGTDMTVKATGNLNLAADGNLNVQNGGNFNVLNGGDIEINNGGEINVASGGKINLTTADDLVLGGQNITAFANESINLAVSEVQVGGANLVRDSANLNNWTKDEPQTILAPDGDMTRVHNPSRRQWDSFAAVSTYTFKLRKDVPYILTFNYITNYSDNLSYCFIKSASGDIRLNNPVPSDSGVLSTDKASTDSRYAWQKILHFTVPRDITDAKIQIGGVYTGDTMSGEIGVYVSKVQIEQATKPTPWKPHPDDPASGVVTSHITIEDDSIDIASGGTLNLTAPTQLVMTAGTTTSAIGVANGKLANGTTNGGYFLWAGSETPSTAPFRVSMAGAVVATKIQQEYSQSFWDLADATYPAEFPVYIPSGYTVDTVTFTFATKKFRSFSKGTSGGTGDTGLNAAGTNTGDTANPASSTMAAAKDTGAASGSTAQSGAMDVGATNNPASGTMAAAKNTSSESSHTHVVSVQYTPSTPTSQGGSSHYHSVTDHSHSGSGDHTHSLTQHTHGLNSHVHAITDHSHTGAGQHNHSMPQHTHAVGSHTHGMDYGIYEKTALATSCALIIGATTVGTYAPNPSAPVEIKTLLSAGWNTITVQPNNDARISAYVLVKLTPT